jgi:hypothetical protein
MKQTVTRQLAAAAVACGALFGASVASAVTVGGVDFGPDGATQHIESTTIAETFINGNGQNLRGYGQVNTVNGNLFYAGTERLYFYFHDYTSANFSPTSVDFTGGMVDIYIGANRNLTAFSSDANVAYITGLTPWAQLTGHVSDATGTYTLQANGTLTGSSISFTGAGLLDVSGGMADVVAYLQSFNLADLIGGTADMAFTSSGNTTALNTHDDITGCSTGQGTPGQWCFAGSGDLHAERTPEVPEPASLALVGLALAGAGFARRRQSRRQA